MTLAPLPVITSKSFERMVDEAYGFYLKNAGTDIAERFLVAVEDATQKIRENTSIGSRYIAPENYQKIRATHYRQINLANSSAYPYLLYYQVEKTRVTIRALYHHSRNRDSLLHS